MLTTDQLDELDRLDKEVHPNRVRVPWDSCNVDWPGDLEKELVIAGMNALPELLAMARQLLRANEYIEVLEASNRALFDGREEWARRCREMAKNQ
jgi:hypothetical protein